ncbi:MAG: DUF421 domain-containing protein, partial [Oscillospiraceae bacterium]
CPSELVTTILISNLASLPVEEINLPLATSIMPILVIVSIEIILSVVAIKVPGVSRLLSGKNKAVIKDGSVDETSLRQLRYSTEDLLEALRNKDVFDIGEVNYAVVETNGKLNVYKYPQFQNSVKADINKSQVEQKKVFPPTYVIVDALIDENALLRCSKSRHWVDLVLDKEQTKLKQVLLLEVLDDDSYRLVKKGGTV